MAVALMWEAKGAPGKGGELPAWVREQALPRDPLRRESFCASEERVLVITWWDAPSDVSDVSDASGDTAPPELPEPPGELAARPVHRRRFEPMGAEPPV